MRAAFVQNIMDPECGQAKHLDDAADDAADRGPWGVLCALSGGLTSTGPDNVSPHCTDCRTSLPSVPAGQMGESCAPSVRQREQDGIEAVTIDIVHGSWAA